MKQNFFNSHSPLGAKLATLVLPAMLALGVAPGVSAGVVIHTAEEILSQQTVVSGDNLFFQDAEGKVWEFITDINDESISNPGAGGFFPASDVIVRDALQAIQFPIKSCEVEIYLLPYPRRGLLKSSASGKAIYVSPGVAPYPETQLHALVAHEMGHIVHRQFAADSNYDTWDSYRALRGIQDELTYNHDAKHKNRPHEVFAEDFRFLFGGAMANYSGGIENGDLQLPDNVLGLKQFFINLVASASAQAYDIRMPSSLQFSPNPTFGATAVMAKEAGIASSKTADLFVYDVRGRQVIAQPNLSVSSLTWDGALSDGSRAAPGIYFVEVRQATKRWVGKLVIAN
jgi:hypothetical protein